MSCAPGVPSCEKKARERSFFWLPGAGHNDGICVATEDYLAAVRRLVKAHAREISKK